MAKGTGGNYPLLLDPVKIAGLKLPNRLVMAPTVVNLGNRDGTPSDRQIEYYRMRAEGGEPGPGFSCFMPDAGPTPRSSELNPSDPPPYPVPCVK
jgi:2,4-dienoyl-CoA reductase-like NADH-dependent reductase (Old Yellow Enzyme family)